MTPLKSYKVIETFVIDGETYKEGTSVRLSDNLAARISTSYIREEVEPAQEQTVAPAPEESKPGDAGDKAPATDGAGSVGEAEERKDPDTNDASQFPAEGSDVEKFQG